MVCGYVARGDGSDGISRLFIPPSAVRQLTRSYPFAWRGILAQESVFSKELVHGVHERGFSLLSMRSPELSWAHLQRTPDADLADWPDERIRAELRQRLAFDDGKGPAEGPIVGNRITPMRSFVTKPMQHGRACSRPATPRTSCRPVRSCSFKMSHCRLAPRQT